MSLIQFDTSGHFKWIRKVGDNTFPTLAGTGIKACIALDGANNVHYLNYLKAGVHITPSVTSTRGTYDLVYNTAGTLLSQMRLDLDSEWLVKGVAIDPTTNKMYAFGELDQYIHGGFATDTFYAAAFDVSRNRLWQYFTGNDTQASGMTGIVLAQSKHLYFSGGAATYIIPIPSTFRFNGMSVTNTHAPTDYAMSIVMKTDTNGHPIWIKHYDGNSSVHVLNSITALPNNKIAAAGVLAGVAVNGSDSIVTPAGEGQNPFLVILDSAGDLQTIQQIHGNGFYDQATAITSDRVGNMYVGGSVEDSIYGGSIPAYHSIGGNTDFFVMKYGMDCSCTSTPISMFTDTGTHTIGATYTGTTTGIDSVVWNFGDGHTATGTSVIHTYTVAGTFRVCATVYTNCGNDIHCSNVLITIPSLAFPFGSFLNVTVYPNPATTSLTIISSDRINTVRIYSLIGQVLYGQRYNSPTVELDVADLPAGTYILKINESEVRRFVKE
jgi:hypothetical protein